MRLNMPNIICIWNTNRKKLEKRKRIVKKSIVQWTRTASTWTNPIVAFCMNVISFSIYGCLTNKIFKRITMFIFFPNPFDTEYTNRIQIKTKDFYGEILFGRIFLQFIQIFVVRIFLSCQYFFFLFLITSLTVTHFKVYVVKWLLSRFMWNFFFFSSEGSYIRKFGFFSRIFFNSLMPFQILRLYVVGSIGFLF